MTFKEDCRQRLENCAARLVDLLNIRAPIPILANELVLILSAAKGAFGEQFYEALLRYEVPAIKQGMAYCTENTCDNVVAAGLSYPPVCEHCDAKIEKEFKRVDDIMGEP